MSSDALCNGGGVEDPSDMTFRPMNRTISSQSLSNLSRLSSYSLSTDFTRGPSIMDLMEEKIRDNVRGKLKSLQVPGQSPSGSQVDLPTIQTRSRSLSTATRSRDNVPDDSKAQIKTEIGRQRDRDIYRQTERDLVTNAGRRTDTSTHTERGRSGVPGRELRGTDGQTGSDGIRGASSMSNLSFIDHRKSNSTPVNFGYSLQVPSNSSSVVAKPSPSSELLGSRNIKTSTDLNNGDETTCRSNLSNDQNSKDESRFPLTNTDLNNRDETRSYPMNAVSRTKATLSPSPLSIVSRSLPPSVVSSPLAKTVEEKTGSVEALLSTGSGSSAFDSDIKFGTKLNFSSVPSKKSGKLAPPVAPKPVPPSKNGQAFSGIESNLGRSNAAILSPYFTTKKSYFEEPGAKSSDKKSTDGDFNNDREIETITISLNDRNIERNINSDTGSSCSSNSPGSNITKADRIFPSSSDASKYNSKDGGILNSRISEVSIPRGDDKLSDRESNSVRVKNTGMVKVYNASGSKVENRTVDSQGLVNDSEKERFVTSSYISLSPYHSVIENNNNNNHKSTSSNYSNSEFNGGINSKNNSANSNNFGSSNNDVNLNSNREISSNSDNIMNDTNNSSTSINSSSSSSSSNSNSNYHIWLDTKRWYTGHRDPDARPIRASHTPSDSIISESSDSGIDRSTIGHSDPDLLDDLDSIINPGSLDDGSVPVGSGLDQMFDVEMEKISSWKSHGENGGSHQIADRNALFDRWQHDVNEMAAGKDGLNTATIIPTYTTNKEPRISVFNNRHKNNSVNSLNDVKNKINSNDYILNKSSTINTNFSIRPYFTAKEARVESGLTEPKIRQDFLHSDIYQAKISSRANGSMTFDERRRKFEEISENMEKPPLEAVERPLWRSKQDVENRERDLALIYGQTVSKNSPEKSSTTITAAAIKPSKVVASHENAIQTSPISTSSSSHAISGYHIAPSSSSSFAKGLKTSEITSSLTSVPKNSEISQSIARAEPVVPLSIKALSSKPIHGDANRPTSATSIISKLNSSRVDNSKPNSLSTTHISDCMYDNKYITPASCLATIDDKSIKVATSTNNAANMSEKSKWQSMTTNNTVHLDEKSIKQSTPTSSRTNLSDKPTNYVSPLNSTANFGFVKEDTNDMLIDSSKYNDINESKQKEIKSNELSIASQSTYIPRMRSRSTNNLLDSDGNQFSNSFQNSNLNQSTSTLATPSADDVTPRYRSLSSSTLLNDDVTTMSSVTSGRASWSREGREIEVVLVKGPLGVGFCIEGGIGSPAGDRPITVKRLFKGETPARGLLLEGDELLRVNDQPISGLLSQYRAWNFLKTLPDGPAHFLIRRSIV